ncbi:MAG TPA: transglutaminase-like domain-containing protein [Bryobacteraceae bacterium]|nr:transglutaminase-like domain-containing protein [Bryobacteraceae bacterium]
MQHLRRILEDPGAPRPRLDHAALELATIQFPDLDPAPVLDRLNEIASQLGDRLRNFNDGRDFVETAQRYLFQELGFHGNEENYFDPLNSCLNQVLERRTGIPVTLSLMYMEISRRLAMPVFGISLPRHFVIEFDDGNYSTYVDPFHGGRTITARECFMLAGARVADPSLLQRASPRQIVVRMVQNLQRIYLEQNDWHRAVETLDLLFLGAESDAPELAGRHKLRGLLLLELKRFQAARSDLETYLRLKPDAADRPEILKQLESIHRWLARLN